MVKVNVNATFFRPYHSHARRKIEFGWPGLGTRDFLLGVVRSVVGTVIREANYKDCPTTGVLVWQRQPANSGKKYVDHPKRIFFAKRLRIRFHTEKVNCASYGIGPLFTNMDNLHSD